MARRLANGFNGLPPNRGFSEQRIFQNNNEIGGSGTAGDRVEQQTARWPGRPRAGPVTPYRCMVILLACENERHGLDASIPGRRSAAVTWERRAPFGSTANALIARAIFIDIADRRAKSLLLRVDRRKRYGRSSLAFSLEERRIATALQMGSR